MASNNWHDEPQEHDFPAAADYLSLLYPEELANTLADKLRAGTTVKKKAKDILRASGLPLLPKDNKHVEEDIDKVKEGKKLSPILLVRDTKLVIADGYHRVCAIYYLSEDLEIPCRITDRSR